MSVSRPQSSTQIGDYKQLNYLKSTKLSTQLFSKLNSFVNSADSGTTNEEFSIQYGVLSSISSQVIRKGMVKSSLLTQSCQWPGMVKKTIFWVTIL